MRKIKTGDRVTQADLDAIATSIDAEGMLARDGIAYLRSLHPDRDYSDLPAEVLIKIARQKDDPTRFGHPNFLRWATVFRRHIALHDYPEGEGRIGFSYRPR